MRFIPRNISLNLPFGLGGVSVDLSEESAQAAWKLYVEYATRIATETLAKGQGSVREALGSIHALFAVTRTILKDGGIDLAREGEHESAWPGYEAFYDRLPELQGELRETVRVFGRLAGVIEGDPQ